MKAGDFAVIILVLILAVTPWFCLNTKDADTGKTVTVEQDGTVIYRGPLEGEERTVTTPDGSNTIVIRDGNVYMQEADCRDQLCVKAGNAETGHPVVCLPNKVTVTVTAGEEGPYDAVSG